MKNSVASLWVRLALVGFLLLLWPTSVVCTEVKDGSDFVAPSLSDIFHNVSRVKAVCNDWAQQGPSKLLLSLATGYQLRQVCPMLASWAVHSPATHVVLFSDDIQVVRSITHRTKGHMQGVLLSARARPHTKYPWHNWRFFIYEAYLALCGHAFSAVLISDARDAILQADIWKDEHTIAAVAQGKVLYTLEGSPTVANWTNILIAKDDDWNRQTNEICFGDATGKNVPPEMHLGPVSCSGIILGTPASMLAYSRAMADVFRFHVTQECREDPDDQGPHNYLMNYLQPRGRLNLTITALPNGISPVYHMAYGLPVRLDISTEQVVVERGERRFIPALVHQLDRDPKIMEYFVRRYVAGGVGCSKLGQIMWGGVGEG